MSSKNFITVLNHIENKNLNLVCMCLVLVMELLIEDKKYFLSY